jgi:hypothetical protein
MPSIFILSTMLIISLLSQLFTTIALTITNLNPTHNNKGGFLPPTHAPGVTVVDYAKHDALPPVRVGERVIDLISGTHFDDLLQDTPDELRPPSLILFTGYQTCTSKDIEKQFKYNAENILPARERLMIAVYDMDAAPVRGWMKFTPEMDLKSRFNVTHCYQLVFVPRSCNGFTAWCEEEKTSTDDNNNITVVGCSDFKDDCNASVVNTFDIVPPSTNRDCYANDNQCPIAATTTTTTSNSNTPPRDYISWVKAKIDKQGEPHISPVFGTYADQGRWLLERDETTTDNILRNYFLVESFPAFTKTGYLAMPIPDKMQKWFLDFYHRRKNHSRATESWHSASTQMSFHENPTTFVSMDQESFMRDKMANEVIKPLIGNWTGKDPSELELTSFYGLREYKRDSWLRNHIDRIETHVLSVTFSIAKLHPTEDRLLTPEEESQYPTWPIEVISWDGRVHRYSHPGGTMVLYESARLVHGRPYHNTGPGHLGAFVHFKPLFKTNKEATAWENIAHNAQRNQHRNAKRGSYKSTPSVEPIKPVFTTKLYGKDTGFVPTSANRNNNNHNKKKSTNNNKNPLEMAVKFKNNSNKSMVVVWISPEEGNFVEQGLVSSGSFLVVNTYVGHRFGWVTHEEDVDNNKHLILGEVVTVEKDKGVYSYPG